MSSLRQSTSGTQTEHKWHSLHNDVIMSQPTCENVEPGHLYQEGGVTDEGDLNKHGERESVRKRGLSKWQQPMHIQGV